MYMPSPMKNVMVNSYDQVHDDEEGKEIEGCLKHAPSLMCKFISFAWLEIGSRVNLLQDFYLLLYI